ncbi:hypothetical protein JMF89_17285 [Clostridiaceae bacterium UIB06]|nr:hypothetical protein [Clostridiaceae bacterium UIB06]
MLGTIVVVTLIALVMSAPVITLALCKAAGESDKSLENPGRITLKGDK